jgi:integrase
MGRAPNKKYLALANEVRGRVGSTIDPFQMQFMSKEQLIHVQTAIGYGSTWGTIDVPASRLPPGAGRGIGSRVIVIAEHLTGTHSSQDVEAYITLVTKFVLLSFLIPQISPSTGTIVLADSTICSLARHFARLANVAMESAAVESNAVLARLSAQSVNSLRANVKMRPELNRVASYHARGYWSDVPQSLDKSPITDYTAPVEVTPTAKSTPFQPFADDFMAALGWRCAWLVENVGPSLVRLLTELFPGHATWADRGFSGETFSEQVSVKLENFRWKDKLANRLRELPFSLNIKGSGTRVATEWPPQHYAQIKVLVGVMQAVNLTILLATTAGRISEVLSVDPNSVTNDQSGYVVVGGRTYKLVFDNEGGARDWPLCDIAFKALSLQKALKEFFPCINRSKNGGRGRAPIVDKSDSPSNSLPGKEDKETIGNSSTSIWGIVGSDRELLHPAEMLSRLVTRLELNPLLKGTNPHPHRFRKTLARLVGLALVGAPKILMDLLGHHQIDMAIGYMLSDPDFRAEIEEFAKAETVMNATDMLKNIDGAGGRAVERVNSALAAEAAQLSTQVGELDLTSLAETFTMGGKSWLLVRPGVVCLKAPHDVGPCSKSKGNPDPASCQSDCGNRFEHALLKADVEGAIVESMARHEVCRTNGDIIGMAEWAGQIQSNIERFPGLVEKFSDNPIIQNILFGAPVQ